MGDEGTGDEKMYNQLHSSILQMLDHPCFGDMTIDTLIWWVILRVRDLKNLLGTYTYSIVKWLGSVDCRNVLRDFMIS